MATDVDVLIVGGGPAGAATALALAARGLRAGIVDFRGFGGSRALKVGETLPPSASPLLRRFGLLDSLREPRHLLCHGNRFSWGSEAVQEKMFFHRPQGHGWHLDRGLFDETLRRRAERAGQRWLPGHRFRKATRRGAGWHLLFDQGGRRREMTAKFLVDASGRAAPAARTLGVGRQAYDRLVGVAGVFRLPQGHGLAHYTHIEAAEHGWWYAAVIPGDRLMVVFMTDADLLDRSWLESSSFAQAAGRTRSIAPLLEKAAPPAAIHSRPASSSRLRQVAGQGWLAVGDAAMAYDPISSHGITAALGGAFYAGHAVADHIAGNAEALPAYTAILEQSYGAYLEMVQGQYALEKRWAESPFWHRRHGPSEEAESDRGHATSARVPSSHAPDATSDLAMF